MWHQIYKAIPQFWVPPPSKQQLYYVLFLHTTQKSLLPTITTNPQVNAILQFTSCNKTRYCKLINTCSKAPHQLHVLHPFFFSFHVVYNFHHLEYDYDQNIEKLKNKETTGEQNFTTQRHLTIKLK